MNRKFDDFSAANVRQIIPTIDDRAGNVGRPQYPRGHPLVGSEMHLEPRNRKDSEAALKPALVPRVLVNLGHPNVNEEVHHRRRDPGVEVTGRWRKKRTSRWGGKWSGIYKTCDSIDHLNPPPLPGREIGLVLGVLLLIVATLKSPRLDLPKGQVFEGL